MKIKQVSCTQFAGIRDRNVPFAEGINVIYGKNESGKSTLVNLIARTLFQNARIDRRKDKEFCELYFPGAIKGSAFAGDFADGKITFETENGTFTLSKEWGADPRCTLSTPGGVIRDQKKIDAVLAEALLYGKGVYSDMIFSSQRNTDTSLQSLLDASQKTDAKQEIAGSVSRAFAESDGISMDAIEQAIQAKIDEVAGKHWDADKNKPVRKAGRWANGLGEILKAYYAMEDANAVLQTIRDLEDQADHAAKTYGETAEKTAEAEEAYRKFHGFASSLALLQERRKNISALSGVVKKYNDVLLAWPRLEKNLETAKALQAEQTARRLMDQYEEAKEIVDELAALDADTANAPCPTAEEITRAKEAQRSIERLQNKLCGMNLNAAVKMLEGHTLQITSLRTGEVIDLADGTAAITEAVNITVPGVMQMQLSPANVDVKEVEHRIADWQQRLTAVLEPYQVATVSQLERRAAEITAVKTKLENGRRRLSLVLGETVFEELEARVNRITGTVRRKQDIDGDILRVCGMPDPAGYVIQKETIIRGFSDEYGSIPQLEETTRHAESQLRQAQAQLSATDNIPEDFLSIGDPEAHLTMLQCRMEEQQQKRNRAFAAKTQAVSDLESYKKNIPGDPQEDAQRAQVAFEAQKSLLAHWNHIAAVFQAQKKKLNDNPMEDIAARFTHYLGVISGGTISSEFPEADKLNMHIYSGQRLLDYGKLSEGTKETVSLAFRLAVLDHLFPQGGVIVFDDPFANMDAQRTAQSCQLMKQCAQRHQVIFLTCKEEYLELLGGNHILV
jgi:DNA repair exonuclease SbcCD ATPase subunit